jgi:hypothetical protein
MAAGPRSSALLRCRHGRIGCAPGTSTAWEARTSPHGEIIENLFYVCDREVERLRTVFRLCEMSSARGDGD